MIKAYRLEDEPRVVACELNNQLVCEVVTNRPVYNHQTGEVDNTITFNTIGITDIALKDGNSMTDIADTLIPTLESLFSKEGYKKLTVSLGEELVKFFSSHDYEYTLVSESHDLHVVKKALK